MKNESEEEEEEAGGRGRGRGKREWAFLHRSAWSDIKNRKGLRATLTALTVSGGNGDYVTVSTECG